MTERPKHNLFEKFDQHKNDLEKLDWSGNFGEYFDMVFDDPSIVKTSHQTAYNALTSREDFFTTGRNALYGAEQATEKFIDALKGGAEGLEVGKRIILLVGPQEAVSLLL